MESQYSKPSILKNIIGVLCVFIISSIYLYLIAWSLTNEVGKSVTLKFPQNTDDVKSLIKELRAVRDGHWMSVFIMFSSAYLYKQTFAIPGSALLNILAGAVFGGWFGVPLVCILAATGASMCFLLSKGFGHDLIHYYLKDRLLPIKNLVSSREDASEFLILVSARMFPGTPNWLLNLCAPHLDVNLIKFFFSVLIGLFPYNFLCVQAGVLLQFTDLSSIMNFRTIIILSCFSLLTISVAWYLKRRKKHSF